MVSYSCILQLLSARTILAHPNSPGAFEEQIVALIRALGLHKPDRTPCGMPISVGEAQAMLEVSRRSGISQTELAERLRLEKSTVSRLVKILEQRGWLDRDRDKSDSRVICLRLTTAGCDMVRRLEASRRARFSRIFAALPIDKRQTVLESLSLLSEVLNES
jgi:DNA-binding MarR family transcriptional regulator